MRLWCFFYSVIVVWFGGFVVLWFGGEGVGGGVVEIVGCCCNCCGVV